MKKAIVLLVLLLLPLASSAAESPFAKPRWSLEFKGGLFTPTYDNWVFFFGKKSMPEFGATLAYNIGDILSIGAGGGYVVGHGKAYAPAHGTLVAEVAYKLYPVDAFIMLRGALYDDQWLIPYIAAGWTRMYYRELIEAEEGARGYVDGYQVRGGLRVPLDALDPRASSTMLFSYGILRTSLFLETEYRRAVLRSTSQNLGGTAYLGGLLFEF